MPRPVNEFSDPAAIIEAEQERDRTCWSCQYNDKQETKCLRFKRAFPNAKHCDKWRKRNA